MMRCESSNYKLVHIDKKLLVLKFVLKPTNQLRYWFQDGSWPNHRNLPIFKNICLQFFFIFWTAKAIADVLNPRWIKDNFRHLYVVERIMRGRGVQGLCWQCWHRGVGPKSILIDSLARSTFDSMVSRYSIKWLGYWSK